jgi:hypothetical protein
MIVYETAAAPSVRGGEAIVAGRRLSGRLFPYGPDAPAAGWRFDPVERRCLVRRSGAPIEAGPWRPEAWEEALGRLPAGPVVVGPGSEAEPVRGAFRAAASAAIAAGRAVYLLDPDPEGLPEEAAASAVALCSWRPGDAASAFPALPIAREAGIPAAALYPLLPGWTGEPDVLDALVEIALREGAVAVTAVAPALDGETRRAIVEARETADPESARGFFEIVHHGDWTGAMGERIARARAAAAAAGLRTMPPRPMGLAEWPRNAAAAARLEELAESVEADEPRAALLYAAVRWIDASGRDLAAVGRDGNFRKIFPFAGEAADAAEAALRETP